MDEEIIEAQVVGHWTFDQLLAYSMQEWKRSLGMPVTVVDASPQGEHVTGAGNMITHQSAVEIDTKDAKGEITYD